MSHTTERLVTVGRLAIRFQADPRAILAAAASANIRPRLEINGVAYFRIEDTPEIRRQLVARRKAPQ